MKNKEKQVFNTGALCIAAFLLWTLLTLRVDVEPVGPNESDVGFATLNCWFHQLTGVHMGLYVITDWLGLVPIAVCMAFGIMGARQWVKRRSLAKVDFDLILLGVYYVIVIAGYLLFEMIPINYRPVLINGMMEVSYPSSTTLLVLSVMPTLTFQLRRRTKNSIAQKLFCAMSNLFAVFMVVGRLISGVHWLTDIIGAVFLSAGIFYLYKAVVLRNDNKNRRQ